MYLVMAVMAAALCGIAVVIVLAVRQRRRRRDRAARFVLKGIVNSLTTAAPQSAAVD